MNREHRSRPLRHTHFARQLSLAALLLLMILLPV